MIHYVVELHGVGDLVTAYPHSPEDQQQSITDYLEDKLANYGLALVSTIGDSSIRWVFRVVAQ